MRLWSLHPTYLDSKGLVACWRETLLAKKVLEGDTKGYKNHSQLIRFKKHPYPIKMIQLYLDEIWSESLKRGYYFNEDKIGFIKPGTYNKIPVTIGQVEYEFEHLQRKLWNRDDNKYFDNKVSMLSEIKINDIFEIVDGDIEPWEVINEKEQA